MFRLTYQISTKRHLSLAFLLGVFTLVTPKTFGQLHVSSHEVLTLYQDIVSQERYNDINTSIMGSGSLILNGSQNQYLDAKAGIHIPNLTLNTNAQVTIPDTFYIDGDFVLNVNAVVILSPIYVKGIIDISNVINLQGIDFIIQHTKLKPQPSPWPRSQQSERFKITYSNTLNKQLQLNRLQAPKLKHSFFYKDMTVSEVAISIPKPPPEDSPLYPRGGKC